MNVALSKPQAEFFGSEAPVAAYISGVGGGKTFVGALWSIVMGCQHPQSVGMVGANVPAQLQAVVVPAICKLLNEMQLQYVVGSAPPWYKSRFESHSNVMSLSTGCQILLRSMFESGLDRAVRGTEVGWVFLDESRDMPEDALNLVLARLRGPGPRSLRLTSTPNGKRGWMYRRLIADKMIQAHVVRGTSRDNEPNLPAGYIDSLARTYGRELYAQEVEGQWIDIQQGLACRFDRAVHVKPIRLNPKLPILFSLDLNVSPMAGVVCQADLSKRILWVLSEVNIRDDAQTRAACIHVANEYRHLGVEEAWHMCDEAGAARSTRSETNDVVIMANEMQRLFPTTRNLNGMRKPRVIDRYNSVNALLQPMVGEPRLFVDPSCSETIADLESVSWDEYGKIDKTDGLRTHWCDALGYLVHRLLPVGSEAEPFGLDSMLEVVEENKSRPSLFPAPVGA